MKYSIAELRDRLKRDYWKDAREMAFDVFPDLLDLLEEAEKLAQFAQRANGDLALSMNIASAARAFLDKLGKEKE